MQIGPHQVDGVIGDVAGDVAKFRAPRIIMKKHTERY